MTTARPQQRYDHRLRELVHRSGDLTIATDLGVPPSTARGWLGIAPTVVVSLEVADLTGLELRQEVLTLRRRKLLCFTGLWQPSFQARVCAIGDLELCLYTGGSSTVADSIRHP